MAARAGAGGTLSCPACGGVLAPWRPQLVRCGDCGSAVTAGPPPPLEAVAYGRSGRAARLLAPLLRRFAGLPARMLRRAGLPQGASVLDVGAGTGRTVAALGAAGFEASGIDPEPRGPGVQRSTIDEHRDAGLDAAVLWHVLEHLDDPEEGLRAVLGWLAPGGLLVIGVPDLSSWQARIAGARWHHLDLPRHRVHFTAAGLRALLDRAGCEQVTVQRHVPEHNPGGMWMALLSRAGMASSYPFRLLKGQAQPRPADFALLVAGLPLIPVAAVIETVAELRGSGGTLGVVARRAR